MNCSLNRLQTYRDFSRDYQLNIGGNYIGKRITVVKTLRKLLFYAVVKSRIQQHLFG